MSTQSAPTQAQGGIYGEERPWGKYTVLYESPITKVKHIQVNPTAEKGGEGTRLSLQSHNRREEHWTIIRGVAEVTVDDSVKIYKAGDTIIIPKGSKHRIANKSPEPVEFIEIQLGDYFGEDDIVRYQDDFNRA